MAATYSLKFGQEVFPFQKKVEIYRSKKKNGNGRTQYFVFLDEKLYSYDFENHKWHTNLLLNSTFKTKVLYFPKRLENEESLMLLKTKEGIHFYQYKDDNFHLLLRSEDFKIFFDDDFYGWDKPGNIIKCGHFYDDKNSIGILTKHEKEGLQFHVVMKDFLMAGEYPIWVADHIDLSVFGNITNSNFFLDDLQHKGQENIIVRSRSGMDVYEFDQNDNPQHLLQVPSSSKINDTDQNLFFPRLTGQSLKDIVEFNANGLFVYQYDMKQKNYNFIHYNPLFGKHAGWDDKYIDTVRFRDVNFDGRDEMFLTGPRGVDILSFDNYTLQWNSVLDVSQTAVSERHTNFLEIAPIDSLNSESSIVFTHDENNIHWAKIGRAEKQENDDFEDEEFNEQPPNTSEVIPEFVKLDIPDEEKPHILLRDQLDLSSILKGVDKDTGKASFEVPLIGLPNFAEGEKMNFYYHGNSKEANILGVGWSFPVSFILMDHQGSIFPDNERYYLFLEDFPQQLLLDSERSTEDVQYFKLSEEQSQTQILYYRSEERWEFEYRGIKQIYGRRQNSDKDSNDNSVNLDLSWKFWRGSGSSSAGQIELPTTWFLSEVRGGLTSATYYNYEMNNVLVPQSNKKFTREIYLKTIHDLEGNKIVFNYSDKDLDEYNLPPLVDESGNFNAKKVQTRYLTGYSLTTSTYRQEVRFNYRVEQGKRLLTEILQDNDPINRPVLQFFYKKIMDSHELERVVLPTDVEVEFNYEVVGGNLDFMDNVNLITEVSSSYRVDYGQDFVLISFLNPAYHISLRMLDRELQTDLYSTSSQEESTRFPFLGEFSVRAYEVKLLYNALIFTLDYESSRAVCLLTREKNKWSLIPKYFNFAKEAIIKIGDDFIAALDATETFVNVIVWDNKSQEWMMEKIEIALIAASPDSLLQASGKVFLIYNDEDVVLGYRNKKNEWDSKVILTLPGVIDKLKWTLSKFDLDSDSYKTIFNLMKSNALQVSNNFIGFNKWDIQDTKSYSFIELYTLTSKYEIGHMENLQIMQDDLITFTQDIEVEDDDKRKSYLTLGYEKKGEQFKITIKDIKGAILDDIEESCKKSGDKCIENKKKEAKESGLDAVKQFFILDMQKYLVYIQSSVVICSGRHFIFNGNNWKLDEVNLKKIESGEWNVPLDEFLLAKENLESSVKLFNQGRNGNQKGDLILDLQVKNFTYISNKYPIYLAYKRENQVNLAFYELLNSPNVKKTFELPPGEIISLMSDHTTLVTHVDRGISDDKNVFLNFRHFMGMKSKLPNPVIKKLTVNFDHEYKRVIGYDYDPSTVKAAGDILFYEKTLTVPGNNRSSGGYIEESTKMIGNYDTVNNIYDASGKLIKIIRAEPYNNNKTITEESKALNSTILDVSGNLEVAQFSPYEMQNEEVSYYGFEDYEVNKIGGANSTNQNCWSFNKSDIVKKEFSLTGENYLQLSKSRLLGVFQPCNQNQHYIASCWIRTTGKGLEIGQIAPYLKAVVYAQDNREINGYFSEVKFQNDNWSYLEVVIDLFYAREVFENLLLSSKSSSEVKDSKSIESGTATANINSTVKVEPFKIVVTVSPGINSTVDVDHIRFSPLNSNFKAITYNYKSKIFKEIINANGLIRRYFHDDFQNQIVSIKESGEIEKISISTKASSVGRMVGLKSKIEIRPIQGFYEDFNPYSFRKRWNVDNNQRWKIAPGELYHLTNHFDKLKLNNIRNFESSGMRLRYALQSESSAIRFNDDLQLERKGDNAIAVFLEKRRPIPVDGEILVIAENNRLIMWIDGGLYFDEAGLDKSLFDLNFYGNTKISELLVFKDVSIRVNYLNALGEKVQEIKLESATSVIVTESLYDEFGRHSITTKPTRLQRSANESVLAYYSNFVTNKNPHSANSIWKLNRIQGEFESLDPYSYYQVTYGDNPLNEKSRIGLPGQDFSVSGFFAQRFSSSTENRVINKMYNSTDLKYRHVVEHKLGGVEDVKVLNNKNNTVAWLVDVPALSTELATYEYNDDGKLMKTLSPIYHKKAGTLIQLEKDNKFSPEENNEQLNSLIVETTYDEKGNVIAKRNPDSGKIEYLYDDSGLQKFTIFYSGHNDTFVENVVYFNYDQLGRLINTGKLISPPEKEKLLSLQLTKNNTEEYQVFYRSDFEREPTTRGRLKRTVTHNDGASFIEELVLNGDKKVVSKRIVVQSENSDDPLLITTNKRYKAGKLREIEYPVNVQEKPFKITYTYDKLGRIKAIGIPSKNNLFVEFAHNSVGHIITEHHLPDKINFNFTRNYSYNSASYLTKLEDKFLTENVYYTEGSFGGYGYGHGLVTRTEFNATWHDFADTSKLRLNEKSFVILHATPKVSKLCFDRLKEAGYINQYNRQAKMYYPLLEVNLPLVCNLGANARLIQKALGQKGFPSAYGHLYDYGAYEELVRAKYFVGDDIPTILLPNTFANIIPKINATTSQDIWKVLKENRYLEEEGGLFSKQGKEGPKSFIRSTLCEDLKSVKENYENYCDPITRALLLFFSKKLDLSLFKKNLRNAIFKWAWETTDINKIEKVAKAIIEMLERKGYLKNPLDGKFTELLQRYKSIVPDIVNVLFQHFGKQLGQAEFDLQAYEIDENGNHKHYYSASDSYKLKYRDNSNQIESVDFTSIVSEMPSTSFAMKHDHRGNVVQALHKGIKNITYHPVSNRATSVELQDGKKLIFNYDAQGERVLKRVLDATGAVKKEVHYVRDEFGRSLVERELTWSSPNLPPSVLVTAYIYGPKGLIGFIRRDEYYSVITDHEGSIRLVVKDGEVVAAYDYLPYGTFMRQYGINSETHISYRYTGQEWDEELGLYNYHARLYDPTIGRFYQHDPKMQYFSPYKYAGNSPVSMIDPNGEEAITFIIFLIVGIYLGGAAASGNWNPLKWDFSRFDLWLGMFLGALIAFTPSSLLASVAAFTAMGVSYSAAIGLTVALGVAGVYVGMASGNNEWDPRKWDFSSPATWSGAFFGALSLAGAPGVINSSRLFFSSLSSIYSKGLFILTGLSVGVGSIAYSLAGRKLDFTKPMVYFEFLNGLLLGFDITLLAINLKGALKTFIQRYRNFRVVPTNDIELLENVNLNLGNADDALESLTRGSLFKVFANSVLKAGELELDFALTFDFNSFINEKIADSNLISFGSLLNKKQKITNDIVPRSKAMNKMKSVAKEIVETYKRIIKDYEFSKESYTDNMRERLEAGIIPNTILAIAMTIDDMAFVAFSGNGGPAFLSPFFRKGDNLHIGYPPVSPKVPRKIAINDDDNINNLMEHALEDKRNIMEEINYKTYLNEKAKLKSRFDEVIRSISSPKLKSYFNNDEVVNIIEKIGDEIKGNGYVQSRERINIIILTFLLQKHNMLKKITLFSKDLQKIESNQINKLIELEEKIVQLEKSVGLAEHEIDQNQAFEEKKKMLVSRLQALREMKDQIYSDVNALSEELDEEVTLVWKDYLRKYLNEFEHWSPTIFTEPQLVTLLMSDRLDFPIQVGAKYTLDDLEYLAIEKVMRKRYISENELITSCIDCKESTRNVTNIVIDPEWENMIAIERTKLLDEQNVEGYCSKRFNFLKPYSEAKSEKMCPKTTKGKVDGIRKKRLAEDKQLIMAVTDSSDNIISENYENKSDYIEDDVSDNDKNKKSTNFTDNLFGWMRTSVNKLFDSTKILPETVSNSNALKGINGTTNNLSSVTAFVDVNSTLLLLDTVIRKVTGQKYISTSDDNATLLESRGYSLDIGMAFEKTMTYAASKSGISMHRFDIHYTEIQDKVIDKIMSGKLDEIAEILISHAEKACPTRETGCPGKLSPKKFEKFIDVFSKRIDTELNEIMLKNKRIKSM